jgi:hypothetical protein
VKSAIATVMLRKISARPACAIDRHCGRQLEQDGDAAEQTLPNENSERRDAEPAQPWALLYCPEPDGIARS